MSHYEETAQHNQSHLLALDRASALSVSLPLEAQERATNLLVVDDTPDNLRLLGQLLTAEGYRVRKSRSGPIALQSAQLDPPDLILLDVLMPGMNGYEVCRQLKNSPLTSQIPIIFISALDQIRDKTQAFDYGGVDYITKPFEGAEVLARVRNQITIRQQQILLEAHNHQLTAEIHQRQQAEAQLHRQITQAQVIAQLTEKIHAAQDLSTLLPSVTVSLQTTLQVDRALIYWGRELPADSAIAPMGSPLACAADTVAAGVTLPPPQPLSIWPHHRSFQVGNGAELIDPVLAADFRRMQVAACIAVPIYLQTRFLGVLMVQHRQPRHWQPQELAMLEQISRQLGIAAHQHHLLSQLQQVNAELLQQSRIDPLTQVGNRRFFDEYLQEHWQGQCAYDRMLSLLLVDIDYFKAYNDTYGHPAGDRCLCRVATVLKQSLSQGSDRVFRYGGEEFALILPDADLGTARQVAEQIRQHLLAEAIDHEMSPVNPYITVSIGGISGCLGGTLSMADYTCLADQALYRAKAAGRNQAQLLTLEESLSLHQA